MNTSGLTIFDIWLADAKSRCSFVANHVLLMKLSMYLKSRSKPFTLRGRQHLIGNVNQGPWDHVILAHFVANLKAPLKFLEFPGVWKCFKREHFGQPNTYFSWNCLHFDQWESWYSVCHIKCHKWTTGSSVQPETVGLVPRTHPTLWENGPRLINTMVLIRVHAVSAKIAKMTNGQEPQRSHQTLH